MSAAPSPRSRRIRSGTAGTTISYSGQLALEYGFTDIDGSRPDVWRYMEDDDARLAPDPEKYR